MTADFDRDAVLAQVAKRKAASEALVAELGIDTLPKGVRAAVSAGIREQAARRRTRRAEDAGQLDLGGLSGT
jgi:hypothetical protein